VNARLQAFARANPVTVITGAPRDQCLGGPAARPALEAAAWLAGLLAVTIPAAVASYRHAASTCPPPAGPDRAWQAGARPLCLQARDYILILEGIPWMLP
jgi:hypothetical protein